MAEERGVGGERGRVGGKSPGDRAGGSGSAPSLPPRSARAAEVIGVARGLLREGPESQSGLTLRRLAEELGIQSPSLYKHFADKHAIEVALIEVAFLEMGTALRTAIADGNQLGGLATLLRTYRHVALAEPGLYRLATAGRLPRGDLTAGLEAWAGRPFFAVTQDPSRAQALWAFAHGMVVLELDARFPDDRTLDLAWKAGVDAFTPAFHLPGPFSDTGDEGQAR